MQKISNYLYPNRIDLTLDLSPNIQEYKIVYQRRFKIYKGFKNDLLLDVKNSDQKRIDVSNKTLKFKLLDQHNQEIYTATASHSSTPGLSTVVIPSSALSNLKPQFLKYSAYIENNDASLTPLYGDTQFGLTGTIELLDEGLKQDLPEIFIYAFNYQLDGNVQPYAKKYYSEAALINPLNDITGNPVVNFDFYFLNLDGSVSVQFTKDAVVQTESVWTNIETFTVSSSTTNLTKTYSDPTYNKDIVWARIYYVLTANTTGKIDKVRIRR